MAGLWLCGTWKLMIPIYIMHSCYHPAMHLLQVHYTCMLHTQCSISNLEYDIVHLICIIISLNFLLPLLLRLWSLTESLLTFCLWFPPCCVGIMSIVLFFCSRNQLSVLPPFLCQLQSLEVLLASNNRLVSLPEEINQLERLMEIVGFSWCFSCFRFPFFACTHRSCLDFQDVSCNEITHLPSQIGDIESLRSLNVRKNLLVELPSSEDSPLCLTFMISLRSFQCSTIKLMATDSVSGISKLSLRKLDISSNRISQIPHDMRKMDSLTELSLENNPLTCPPAHVGWILLILTPLHPPWWW